MSLAFAIEKSISKIGPVTSYIYSYVTTKSIIFGATSGVFSQFLELIP